MAVMEVLKVCIPIVVTLIVWVGLGCSATPRTHLADAFIAIGTLTSAILIVGGMFWLGKWIWG